MMMSGARVQYAAESDQLFLSTRQTGWIFQAQLLYIQQFQNAIDAVFNLLSGQTKVLRAKGQLIFYRGQKYLGIGILKNDSDPALTGDPPTEFAFDERGDNTAQAIPQSTFTASEGPVSAVI